MSPTVPPISLITTSVGVASDARRMRSLISFVMCGMTWTVEPRYSPLRSLRSTAYQIAPAVWFGVAREVLVDEALVVADVEVGLGAVLGDEDLAVLERAHRPGSTLMYGSNFWTCTLRPRALSSRPSDAATMPFPSDETTPPVTKTYFVGRSRARRPSAVELRRTGVRSISSPSERRSPRRVSPASAPIASHAASSRESAHGPQA